MTIADKVVITFWRSDLPGFWGFGAAGFVGPVRDVGWRAPVVFASEAIWAKKPYL
jgi:hypothetical protein